MSSEDEQWKTMIEINLNVELPNRELHKKMVCGECMVNMDEVKPNSFVCPECGRSCKA